MLKSSSAAVLVALFSFLLVGCGDDGPATYTVTGKVTLDGTEVEGAVITFVPAGGDPAAATASTSKADGTFTAKAQAGNYKIKVSKFDALDGGHSPYGDGAAAEPAPDRKMTQEEQIAMMEAGYGEAEATPQGKEQRAKNNLPDKYNDIGTSGLTATVTSGGSNELILELTK